MCPGGLRCGVIESELGWAAKTSAESGKLRDDRDLSYEWLATHDEDWRRALDVQAALGRGGQARPADFPGLLIAAVGQARARHHAALRRRLRPHRSSHRPAHAMGHPPRDHPLTSARLQPCQRRRRATCRAEPDRRNDRPAALRS